MDCQLHALDVAARIIIARVDFTRRSCCKRLVEPSTVAINAVFGFIRTLEAAQVLTRPPLAFFMGIGRFEQANLIFLQ